MLFGQVHILSWVKFSRSQNPTATSLKTSEHQTVFNLKSKQEYKNLLIIESKFEDLLLSCVFPQASDLLTSLVSAGLTAGELQTVHFRTCQLFLEVSFIFIFFLSFLVKNNLRTTFMTILVPRSTWLSHSYDYVRRFS